MIGRCKADDLDERFDRIDAALRRQHRQLEAIDAKLDAILVAIDHIVNQDNAARDLHLETLFPPVRK